jgi:hypothetical protein
MQVVMDNRRSDDGKQRPDRRVSAQRIRRFEDRCEAPATRAVDEQADEDALPQETRAVLHRSARHEQEAEDVVVYADVHAGDSDESEDAADKDAVDAQILGEAAFDAEGPDLAERNAEEAEDDDNQGGNGAGLVLDVVRGEALDGDVVEGVVIQGANPAAAEPEDSLFDLSFESEEGALHGEVVDAVHAETGR